MFELTGTADLGSLGAEWLDLAATFDNTSYFQTPDWVLAWWETIGGQPFTRVATWRDDSGGLEAIAALSRVSEQLDRRVKLAIPVWANTGSGPGKADHCGWLARPNRIAAVQEWVLQQSSGGTLLLRNLDPEVSADAICTARPVCRTACPRLQLVAGDSEVGRSANFREQLRARRRRLQRAGVTMSWVESPNMDYRIFESLLSLHTARWRAKGAASSFTAEHAALHSRLIAQGGTGRGPAAVIAEHRDQVIGVLYGFWWNDVFAYYQLGWNPTWARYSLGTLLLQQAIDMARSRKARVFDFLRGSELFKYRFGAHNRVDTTFIVPRGWSGAMLASAFSTRELLRSILFGSHQR